MFSFHTVETLTIRIIIRRSGSIAQAQKWWGFGGANTPLIPSKLSNIYFYIKIECTY